MIAEFAFSLFVERNKNLSDADPKKIDIEAWRATKLRLDPYLNHGIDLETAFNRDERADVEAITNRLTRFFSGTLPPLVLRPVFTGCGYIDASEGDVISSDIVYEIKTVERRVRSTDVRQVITYAALNYASGQFEITKMGLFNPRGGYYFHFDLDFVCGEIAGTSSQELFMTIVDAISSGEISR